MASTTKEETPRNAAQQRKLVKRACDPCKVRKIKCSEVQPCKGCVAARINCTFHKVQATRGPKNLRARTVQKIAQTQGVSRFEVKIGESATSATASGGENGIEVGRYGERVGKLLELLDIYAERLYPIWPIVDAAHLSRTLANNPDDAQFNHLAEAVALATIAQLKLPSQQDVVSVSRVEKDSQTEIDDDNRDHLFDSLRVSFFLHIHYENEKSGGMKSLVYLRETITKAQLLRMDREVMYGSLGEGESQVYRRVLWLLFVTERGVALLHKLPVILKPNIMFPWFGRTDDKSQVLPAFLKLVHLFWVFDQSGIFELLRNSDSDVSSMESLARGCLELLQKKLKEASVADEVDDNQRGGSRDGVNDVQRADMFVTRHWMRAVLWRAALRFGVVSKDDHPVDVAGEFLVQVERLPKVALESQGPTLEFKTFEIATAVIDAVASNYPTTSANQPQEILQGLQRILSSSRGGNKALLSLLNARMAAVAPDLRMASLPLSPPLLSPGTAARLYPTDRITEIHTDSDEWARAYHTGILGSSMGGNGQATGYNGRSIEEQTAQMSWGPLDLGNLMRPPSPMTQMLLEHHAGEQALMG